MMAGGRSNGWQCRVDYRDRLSEADRAWLDQWTREEYFASYEHAVLSPEQAREARRAKARQARDVMNQAVYLEEAGEMAKAVKITAGKKKTEKKGVNTANMRARLTKERHELSFLMYSTAEACCAAAKCTDPKTANNVLATRDFMRKMAVSLFDEYVQKYGAKEAQQKLMGLYEDPTKNPLDLNHQGKLTEGDA